MGEQGSYQMTAPLKNKIVRAGEYVAIGYNLQGISQKQLENTKQTLENVKGKLELYQKNKDQTALAGLTKHDLTGAILQAGVQSYFAVNQTQEKISQKQAGVVTSPKMSFGTFSTNLKTDYRFGIATRVTPVGLNMDIDRILSQAVNKDNNHQELIAYNQSMGMLQSLNENAVPEMLMNTKDEKNVEGISAVKAIQLASQQGQKIYTINKDNYSNILSKLNHDKDALNDIRNAVHAGKVVTTHEQAINHIKWHGSGYIITDATTGMGAYMISGRFNGGDIGLSEVNDFLQVYVGFYGLMPAELFELKLPNIISSNFTKFNAFLSFLQAFTDGYGVLEKCGLGYAIGAFLYSIHIKITQKPFTLSLSKGRMVFPLWFDRLTTNGKIFV